jgi:hypothetical protein
MERPDAAAIGTVVRERLVIHRGEDGEVMDEKPTVETENIGLMRKIIYNLLKPDNAVQNMSVRAKQIYYRNNPETVCRLLFEVIPGA